MLTTFGQFISAAEFNDLHVQKWNDYKTQFDKKYETAELENQRMAVFVENSNKVTQHKEKFENGETAEEFKKTHASHGKVQIDMSYCRYQFPKYDERLIKALPSNLGKAPESKNWVKEGAVTDVKDQGTCASCWDFAAVSWTISTIESHYYLHGPQKKLVSLSTQQVLDCLSATQKYGTNNCKDGGCPASALQYVIDNGGIDADQSYGYLGKEGKCQYKLCEKKAAIKDFKIVMPEDEKLLKEVVGLIGPVTCAVNIDDDFRFYSSGIFSSNCCKKKPRSEMNHDFVIVGYGSENGVDYWLCKNEWGNDWGEGGYIRIRPVIAACCIPDGVISTFVMCNIVTTLRWLLTAECFLLYDEMTKMEESKQLIGLAGCLLSAQRDACVRLQINFAATASPLDDEMTSTGACQKH
ncbi:cathepsin L-like [Planococcus citri]|uniref:cathepsin L-like n=1 Tax=Planococcus citri TaxID=170843 RepID=UPI0031F7BB00